MEFAYGNDAEYWHDKYQQLVDSLDKLYEVFCETENLYWEQLPVDGDGKPIKLDEYRYSIRTGVSTRWHIVAYHSGNEYDVIGRFGEVYKPFKACELYSTADTFESIIESVAEFCIDYVDPGPEQLKPFVKRCEKLAKVKQESTYFEERTCHMTRDADYPCAEEGCERLMFPKWICSECEWDKLGEKPNYCPNCGAKVID